MAAPIGSRTPTCTESREVTQKECEWKPGDKELPGGARLSHKKGEQLRNRAPRRLTTIGLLMEAAHEISGCTTGQVFTGALGESS